MEYFNVRNKKCQEVFHEFTSKEGRFTSAFSSCEESIDVQFKSWKRILNKSIHACFRKIRLRDSRKETDIEQLMNVKRNILKKRNISREEEEKVENIDKQITREIADKELEKLVRVTGELDEETNVSIWKEMRK